MEQSSLVKEDDPLTTGLFKMEKFCTDSFMQGEKLK
jgi:hypothetical protein